METDLIKCHLSTYHERVELLTSPQKGHFFKDSCLGLWKHWRQRFLLRVDVSHQIPG